MSGQVRIAALVGALALGCGSSGGDSDDGADGESSSSSGVDTGTASTPSTSGVDESGSETTAGGPEPGVTGLLAVPANEAVGLEWELVEGATNYNLYWSTEPGVTPQTGQPLPDVVPGFIHEGLENGTTYHYVVTAIGGNGESVPSEEAAATPGGEWRLFHFGPGTIDDIVTGDDIWIPIEDRIHVAMLPEGYLAGELPVFDVDVQDWFDGVFVVEPYSQFPEAFVVWTLPRASNEHVTSTSPQTADTAFVVPITASGSDVDSVPSTGPTAARVWQELADFPYPPVSYWPSGGKTHEIAKNLVVHVLVLDPADGESGFGGKARRLENPMDPSQKLSGAFAHNRAHEFSHALTRLSDEYLDVDQMNVGEDNAVGDQSAWVSNVMMQPSCDTLPWSHLFVGSTINPDTDELVGAFGTAEIGFHSEFKCLMNGTHDNDLFYGGDGRLRSTDRFCNWCRELTAFRLLERVGILDDSATSLDQWASGYRTPFYERFGFSVPAVVPQENSVGDPWFEACAP